PATLDISAHTLNPELVGASGPRQVVVRLSGESVAQAAAARASAQSQADVATAAVAQQDAFLSAMTSLDASAKVLARLTKVLNAVVVEVDGAILPALAAQPGVVSINPVRDYELDLSETVPYIGATPAVQAAGLRGKNVKVAVLDSGIDYTHVAFGGPGTLADYQAAYGTSTTDPRNTTLDGLFPTARVVGGYDFVGEAWPNGPLAPDPDPIDCGAAGLTPPNTCAGGHGTNVADIIGGANGVAPEVDLYAVKVCSSVSPSCSGVAL
ncbi:MAG: S8 family serine peptidase, partial [Roseiflexaceae bacterium]|nr:S8 family serine peptidase [Roseiflexaceae bacterium]